MAERFRRSRKATKLHESQDALTVVTSMPETQPEEDLISIDTKKDNYMDDIQSNKETDIASPTKHIQPANTSVLDNEMFYLLATGLKEFWQKQLFQDVSIHCGKDGGIIRCHRLVLAGLSPFLQHVLKTAEDAGRAYGDEEIIILPDVSSKVLLFFLDSVYKGNTDMATVDEEIRHLQFSHEFKPELSIGEPSVESKSNIDDHEENGMQLEGVSKSRFRSKRSFVWDYFSPVGKQNAQCNVCKKIQKVEKSSTTYLIRHLKNHHTKHYLECRNQQKKEEDGEKEDDESLSNIKDRDAILETSQHSKGIKEDVEFGPLLTNELKSSKPSPSKFRLLTSQISKLAKSKEASKNYEQSEGGERRKRSLCWKYFTRLEATTCDTTDDKDDGGKVCECNICGESFPLSSSKSTILMLRHLRRRHKEVFNDSSSANKEILKECHNKIVKVEERLTSPKGRRVTINHGHSNLAIQSSEKEDGTTQKVAFGVKKEIVEQAKISMKRKHNATLKEQKELREKGLIMFSKPTKPRVKTPSVAWIFFEVINKDTARCIICDNVVPTPLWNTNGLLRHLKKDHLDECERWEAENVHNFDPTQIPTGQIHPIWQHFKQMDDILKDGAEAGSYACNHCDIVHVGLQVPQQIYLLESHLKQLHPEDSCKEYEMDKVAILCRKRKEQMKEQVEEPANSNVLRASSKRSKTNLGSLDTVNNAGRIVLQPDEIIHDIKKGLLNILAGDFFSQFSRDTMQCKLCSASCKVLTNGPNRSNNLWKHLSVSHVDVHAQLEAEREIIAQSLKQSNPAHPIWDYFKALERTDISDVNCEDLHFMCIQCQNPVDGVSVELGGHLSDAVGQLEKHLSREHSNDDSEAYKHYQKRMNTEDVILSLDQFVWIETRSGLSDLCNLFFEMVENNVEIAGNQFKCKACNTVLDKTLYLNIDEQKCRHLLKSHKIPLFNHMKTSKQKGMFLRMQKDFLELEYMKNVIVNQGECICSKCDNFFVSSTALESHDRYLHSRERPYACEECERTFVRSDELKTHRKYHSDRALQKGAMCVACGKQFNSATARKRHENTVHLDIRNHRCKMCGKKFHSPQALERHSHTHSDEKPFVCTECGAKFREKHQLTSHFRTHTGEASITCPNCPQTFKHYAGRSKHKCAGDLLINNPICTSWEQPEVEKVDVSVVTVSSTIPHQFKEKIPG